MNAPIDSKFAARVARSAENGACNQAAANL